MEEIRIQIIKDILDTFGTFGIYYYDIANHLMKGESLAEYLKKCCVIYPIEYDGLLKAETKTLGELADTLTRITTLIRNKQKLFDLYQKYSQYFLGESISYENLDIYNGGTYRESAHLDLRDENGYIDYKPYLEALGITDLEHISEQYPGKGR